MELEAHGSSLLLVDPQRGSLELNLLSISFNWRTKAQGNQERDCQNLELESALNKAENLLLVTTLHVLCTQSLPRASAVFLRIIKLSREFVKRNVLRGVTDVRTSTRYTSIWHFRFWHRINCKILSEVSKKSLSFHCYAKHKLLLLRHQTRTSYDRHARSKKHRNPQNGCFLNFKAFKKHQRLANSQIFLIIIIVRWLYFSSKT